LSPQRWPDLHARLLESGAEHEVQELLETFLTLSEQDPAGMRSVLNLFARVLKEKLAQTRDEA
jgi:Trp operon repressor